MKKSILILMALIVFAVAGTVMAASHTSGSMDEADKALFVDKCSLCHSLENATDMTDTPKGWRDTVTRMRDENGCALTNQEFETIIAYLSKHYGR